MSTNLDFKEIYNNISKNGFHIIPNFVEEKELHKMRDYWLNFFSQEKFKKIKNIHKTGITLGDQNYLAYSNDNKIKMLRQVEYLWNTTEAKLTKKYAIQLNKIRNKLLNKDENYGLIFSEDNVAMHYQVNYYQPNEGFMCQHVDGTQKTPMINITFNLTSKNIDFEEGGINLLINDKLINLDDLSKSGDVIIFDGNLKHEVKKIISNKNIGRIGVFPLLIRFYNPQEIPHFLKKISHGFYAFKRRILFQRKKKLPNEF